MAVNETKPEKAKVGFKPVIGFLGATAISVGGIIGSGIFFIMGIAAGEAGPAVVLSLLLAGVIAVFTATSFASLGSRITREGGEYQFVYYMLGRKIGFVAGVLWIFSTAIAAVTVSLAFASYLSVLVPGIGVNLVASAACMGFVLVDLVGIRVSASVNNLFVVAKVGVLLFFIFVGLPFVRLEHFQPLFSKGFDGLLSSTFLIFFAYAGFGKIAAASEEVKEPQKNVPRAIIASVLICAILYVAAGFVSIGVSGADELSSSQYAAAPFAYVMLSTGIAPAFFVVAIGALAATANVLLIQILGISRTIYAMSVNGQLPDFLSELHPRFRTPYRAELMTGILMAASALLLSANSAVGLTSLGILSYYALINIAALRIREGRRFLTSRHVVSVLGLLSSSGLIAYYLSGILHL